VTAIITERHARVSLGIDTDALAPRRRALTRKLAEEAPFRSTDA
jgi:hypothetical protein